MAKAGSGMLKYTRFLPASRRVHGAAGWSNYPAPKWKPRDQSAGLDVLLTEHMQGGGRRTRPPRYEIQAGVLNDIGEPDKLQGVAVGYPG